MKKLNRLSGILCLCLLSGGAFAQTDADAIMLNKKVLCIGGMYSYNSWKDYWEGTFKRDNENISPVHLETQIAVHIIRVIINIIRVVVRMVTGTFEVMIITNIGMKPSSDALIVLKTNTSSYG